MRIIAGRLGGRLFDSPHGHRTHPMSEKARGGLFGALGDIEGLSVLDAFSGSGALAFEAISRGARSALAIDSDPNAYAVIKKNIAALDVQDQVHVTKAYAGAWSTRHQAKKFDLVLLDPPYDNIPYRDLKRMPRHLSENGVLVLSWPAKFDKYHFDDLKLPIYKKYGDNSLLFFTKL